MKPKREDVEALLKAISEDRDLRRQLWKALVSDPDNLKELLDKLRESDSPSPFRR